ncbi:DNA repair protein rad2 [Lobaria immixta]|nr:DNA repair protein rad2 [Lobaria immixta]
MAPSTQAPKFDRPLPFESLHLGKSILGKKKKKISEHEAGGSEKLSTEPKEKAAQPMPPCIGADDRRTLKKQETGEVINLDSPKDRMALISSDVRVGTVVSSRASNPSQMSAEKEHGTVPSIDNNSDIEKAIEWEETDLECQHLEQKVRSSITEPTGSKLLSQPSQSSTPDFENIGIRDVRAKTPHVMTLSSSNSAPNPSMLRGESTLGALPVDDEGLYSDPEDEDLMRQLAIKRKNMLGFASTPSISNLSFKPPRTTRQNSRQLRNQTKTKTADGS